MGPIILFLFFFAIFFFYFKTSNRHKTYSNYTIPEKYIEFPIYNGTMSEKPRETISKNYTRLTLFYSGKPNTQYLDSLYIAGFEKASDVRYERNNTYVIFEKIGNSTKIAFHIKNSESNNPINSK